MRTRTEPCSDEDSDAKQQSLFDEIEVLEVNKDNINIIWPHLLISIKGADLIALDLELSGLGMSTSTSKNLEERYSQMRETARSRGIISVGIACFKSVAKVANEKCMNYKVQVFNVLTLCAHPFTIEPDALKFLARNAFDFNKLISNGIPYSTSEAKKDSSIRSLFTEILSCGVPIALHNGLYDLIFMYHHFYSPLPQSVGEFCNALNDLFPTDAPLCDSKFLAECLTRMKSSFLEYVFRFCQRENASDYMSQRWSLFIVFQSPPDSLRKFLETTSCCLPDNFPDHVIPCDIKEHLCERFAAHGNCNKECKKVHDVDYALDLESERREKDRRKRKRKFDHLKADCMVKREHEEYEKKRKIREAAKMSVSDVKKKNKIVIEGCHRAGVDAFMTGFSVLYQCRMDLAREGNFKDEVINRIPLSGKDLPLHIHASLYAGRCTKHEERFAAISSCRERKQND